MDIKNKLAVVTGGSRGIGFAIAHDLLKNGAKYVAVLDINDTEGHNAIKTLDAEFGKGKSDYYHCDVTNTDELKKLFADIVKMHKNVDILVNNAGIGNESDTERMIDINVKAVIMGNLLAIEHMGKHKGGKGGTVINVASGLGLLYNPVFPIYSATKHAVVGYTRCMKEHNDTLGIRIMAICPGWTQTPMAEQTVSSCIKDIITKEQKDTIIDKLQPASNVGIAVSEMIRKGSNGAIWVSANGLIKYIEEPSPFHERMHPVPL